MVEWADVLKIDVEGAELGVLRGATSLFMRSRPVVMFESAPGGGASLGYSTAALFDWFNERDYELLIPNRVRHDGPALCREAFVESHFYPRRTTNYFAIPAEKRVRVRDCARRSTGM